MKHRSIHRGEVYFVKADQVVGSEMKGERPAIIVSNDTANRYSQVVTIVYLTTQAKRPLPTHVPIFSTGKTCVALCEQPTSISLGRLLRRVAMLSEEEMYDVDQALLVGLGLNTSSIVSEISQGNH